MSLFWFILQCSYLYPNPWGVETTNLRTCGSHGNCSCVGACLTVARTSWTQTAGLQGVNTMDTAGRRSGWGSDFAPTMPAMAPADAGHSGERAATALGASVSVRTCATRPAGRATYVPWTYK